MEKDAFLGLRTDAAKKAIIVAEANAAGKTISEYVLAAVMKENAANATTRAALSSPSNSDASTTRRDARSGPVNPVTGRREKQTG